MYYDSRWWCVPILDGKNSTAPQKNTKKHVFLGLEKNTKKHQGVKKKAPAAEKNTGWPKNTKRHVFLGLKKKTLKNIFPI